jgi:hypothetical protein
MFTLFLVNGLTIQASLGNKKKEWGRKKERKEEKKHKLHVALHFFYAI